MPSSGRAASFTAALLILVVQTAAGQELTERELLERFVTRNPQIRELQAGVAAFRQELRSRTLYPNPTASYTREGAGFTEFLEIEQPFIVTDRRRHLREAGDAAVRASEFSVERSTWELRMDLRVAFYRLVEAQEKQKIVRSSIDELDKIVGILRQRETEGEGSKFDRLRTERELLEARSELAAVELAVTGAQNRVAALASAPELSRIRAIGDLIRLPSSPSLDALVTRALAGRKDVLAAKAQVDRFEKEKLGAERLRIPDPVLRVGLKRGEGFPGIRNGSVVAVTVPIPLFDRGKTQVARAEAEFERAGARLDFLERQIRGQVTAAHAAYELRKTMAEQYTSEPQKIGSELVLIAQTAYEEGEKTILELLDVYRVSRQAELRVLELLAATKEAQIEIERAVGEEVFP